MTVTGASHELAKRFTFAVIDQRCIGYKAKDFICRLPDRHCAACRHWLRHRADHALA